MSRLPASPPLSRSRKPVRCAHRPSARRPATRPARQKKALYLSSPIGLGHGRRDIAIAQELRKLQPGLQVDWLAQDPAHVHAWVQADTLHRHAATLHDDLWLRASAKHIAAHRPRHQHPLFRVAAAAVLCLSIGGGWLLGRFGGKKNGTQQGNGN